MEQSKKCGEKSPMYEALARTRHHDIREARDLLQELFFQGTIGARVLNAQRALRKWGDNRVSEIFTGKARRIDGYELDALRAMKRARQLKEAQNQYAAVTDDIARLEAMLTHGDEAYHGETIAALGEVRRTLAGTRTETERLIRRGRG